jgi:hypothetical protein
MSAEDRKWAITQPLYCKRCSQAEDMRPSFCDLESSGTGNSPRTCRGESMRVGKAAVGPDHSQRLERRVFGYEMKKRAQQSAEALLPELAGFELQVWQLVCEGLGERAIAERLGWSRVPLYDRVIRPLRLRCGLPVRGLHAAMEKERRKGRETARAEA